MEAPTIEFLEELRERARRSGWTNDYVEVAEFVKEMYRQAGLGIDQHDLEPYPVDQDDDTSSR